AVSVPISWAKHHRGYRRLHPADPPGDFPADSAADQVIEGDAGSSAQDEEVAGEVQERPREAGRRTDEDVPGTQHQPGDGLSAAAYSIAYPVRLVRRDQPFTGGHAA